MELFLRYIIRNSFVQVFKMNYFTKRTVCIVILFAFMFVSLFSFSVSATDKSDIRDQLSIMGLSDEFLNCISDEMMKKIIQNIGDYDVYDISYNNNDRPINLSDRDDIAVKNISIVLKDKNTDDITGECVCIYWLWKSGKPIAKQQDLLDIRWYNNDFIYDGSSFYAEDYRISDGKIDVSNTYTRLSGVQLSDKSHPAEISYYTDLQYFGGQNGGCAVFNLVPSKPMKSEDKAPNSVVVEYTHYYKTTIVLFVLSAIIVAVIVFICFRKKKSKRSGIEQAN